METTDFKKSQGADLVALYGQVWDTAALQNEFVVRGFMAPFVAVTRKSDGIQGTLQFQHSPRYYFNWEPDGDMT